MSDRLSDESIVSIRPFRPSDALDVSTLNRAWLEAYALLEPADEPFLADPAADLVAHGGGAIFIAADVHDHVLGCVAMLSTGDRLFELAKLAVAPAARGRGVGRRLVDAALGYARERGAARVTLVSNSQLQTALRIYESVGFERRPVPDDVPYATADVYMELRL